MSQHLFLTGYRGTGKTSVATIVAQRLGLRTIDLDEAVEAAAGKSIREIFSQSGESAFRDLERESLRAIPDEPRAVVSLGGGAILRQDNRDWIRAHGVCVWLDATAEDLAERIAGDQTTESRRPALTDLGLLEEIRPVLAQREPLYRQISERRVLTTGKSIEQVADEVITWLAST